MLSARLINPVNPLPGLKRLPSCFSLGFSSGGFTLGDSMAKKKEVSPEDLWPSWTDVLGNTYGLGDIVAIAVINGKSPQMVIARVERINRVNSSGELITERMWFDHDEPIRHERECYKVRNHREYLARKVKPGYRAYPGLEYGSWYADHQCVADCTEYWEKGEYRPVPWATVKCTPLKDARGFRRWGTKDGEENRAVTYSIPDNIVLIERAMDVLEFIV